MSFSNGSITPPFDTKPHIVFIGGFWRVSRAPSKMMWPRMANERTLWVKAHNWADKQNNRPRQT